MPPVGVAAENADGIGCPAVVAGDDTIMCAVRSVDDTIAVMSRLRKLVED